MLFTCYCYQAASIPSPVHLSLLLLPPHLLTHQGSARIPAVGYRAATAPGDLGHAGRSAGQNPIDVDQVLHATSATIRRREQRAVNVVLDDFDVGRVEKLVGRERVHLGGDAGVERRPAANVCMQARV